MTDTTAIRIALQSVRELEIEVADGPAAAAAIETGIEEGRKIVWITDSRGHRFGLTVDKLAFVEVEDGERRSKVGFGIVD
jgi:hypothetical protein